MVLKWKIFTANLNPIVGSEQKGVIELLWDIFGGTINEQGFKVLDSHVGAIYGDSINLLRQVQIYTRLAEKGFAATNIVLGVGSFTYQFNTRDTLGFAAKGAWFEVEEKTGKCSLGGHMNGCPDGSEQLCELGFKCMCPETVYKSYDIYKDPVTDDGTKKSLKGLLQVTYDDNMKIVCLQQCTPEQEDKGLLQTIYQDGNFSNQTTLTQIRAKLNG